MNSGKAVRAIDPEGVSDLAVIVQNIKFIVSRYFKFIVLVCLISSTVGWVRSAYFLPKQFKADALIMPKSRGSSGDMLSSKAGSVIAAMGLSVSSATQDSQQLQALLRSKKLEAAASMRLSEKYTKEYIKQNRGLIQFNTSVAGLIFTLSAFGPTGQFAFDAMNIYLEELQNIMLLNQSSQSSRAVDFINARIDEVKKGIDLIETQLVKMRTSDRADGGKSIDLQISHLKRDYQVQNTVMDTLVQQREIAQIDAKRDEQMFVIIDPPVIPGTAARPNPKASAQYGLMVGAIIAMGVIFLLQKTNRLSWLRLFESRGA